MGRNGTRQILAREPEGATHKRATDPRSGVVSIERKPYASPRLTEYGRMPAMTLLVAGSGALSDRTIKEAFSSVDPHAILAAVARLPIERWSYKGESVRHLGPMAQDFTAAFGLGADDRHIFTLDAAGVALAAIQGLHALARAQEARLGALERELTTLRGEAAGLRATLALRETEPVA